MTVFEKIHNLLVSNEVAFTHLEHEATPTSADSARIRGDHLSQGAKAIVYKVEQEFYLFVFAADKKINTKKIKAYFKSQGWKAKKSRFASVDELLELTGLVPGAVPPFGEPIFTLPLFVDPSLLENEKISFNAGSLTNSITMQLEDYVSVAKPTVFEFVE